MSDLINRDDVINILCSSCALNGHCSRCDIYKELFKLPTTKIEDNTTTITRHPYGGIMNYDEDGECDNCGKIVDALWDFCPSCGKKLVWRKNKEP